MKRLQSEAFITNSLAMLETSALNYYLNTRFMQRKRGIVSFQGMYKDSSRTVRGSEQPGLEASGRMQKNGNPVQIRKKF